MNTRSRLERWKPARWFVLMLGLFLFLTVIGYQIWTLVARQPTSPRNVFHQTAARPGTNQPLTAQNLSHLHLLWTYAFAPDLAYDITIANGVVFMNGLENLIALQNGKRLWRYSVPGDTRTLPTFQVSGNVVYLATNAKIAPYTEKAIYALNAHTGQELWQYHSRTSLTQLTSDQTLLYFSTDQDVGALDSKTGTLQWQYHFSDGSPYAPSVPSLGAASGHLYLALWTSPYRAGIMDPRIWTMEEVRIR